MHTISADVVIVGSGAGGGTLAWALRAAGRDVLLVERGDLLPREPDNWNAEAVFAEKRYAPTERWLGPDDREILPAMYYVVGGSTTFWGACLPRFRREDFGELEHRGGVSPAWPISYDDFAPYYDAAEDLLGVHGERGVDPTDPAAAGPYPFPAIGHEPAMQRHADRLAAQGLHPFPLPLGVDRHSGGKCIRCSTCDAFACRVEAKNDVDVRCVRPALASGGIRLEVNTFVHHLETDASGAAVVAAIGEHDREPVRIEGRVFVISAGAVNSAALLLRSASPNHPHGLANSSGLVGRGLMLHNLTAIMAVSQRPNPTVFQKTLGVNDWYLQSPGDGLPLGNLQTLGKIRPNMLATTVRGVPRRVVAAVTKRSWDWFATSEDLPDPDNRVTVTPEARTRISWSATNATIHDELVRRARRMLRRAGFPVVLTRRFGIENNSHQCGTIRFGNDTATAPLDPLCRSHDVANLYVVDASFMPSSAAVNPGLTVVAQALRVARLSGLASMP